MKKHIRVAFACALSLTAASAMAASTASASITGLTFTLVDLTPEDSNASFYNLRSELGYSRTLLQTRDDSLNASESRLAEKYQLLGDTPLTSSQGNASVVGASTADSLSASGAASGATTAFMGIVDSRSYTLDNQYGGLSGIQLAPHSMLIVSAQASANAWAGPLHVSPAMFHKLKRPCRCSPAP